MSKNQNNKVLANLGLRAINYFIDSMLSYAFSVAAMIYLVLVLGYIELEIIEKLLDNAAISYSLYVAIFVMSRAMYYVVFEYFLSKTPAKFLTGTVIVSTSDSSSLKQLFIRSFARLIPFNEFSIFRQSGTTWHDDLSGSIVIRGRRQRFTKSRSIIMNMVGVVCLILVALTFYFFVWAGSKQLSGELKLGALEVPTSLPQDVLAVSVIEKEDDISFYEISYKGGGVEFTYAERTAGFQFNPREDCVLTTSTNRDFGYAEIPEGLKCEKVDEFQSQGEVSGTVRVYRIDALVAFPSQRLSEVPEYYIAVAPQRYVIDVQQGSLSDEEVLEMAKTLVKRYPEEIVSETGN